MKRDIGTFVALCVNDERGTDVHRVRAVRVQHDADDPLSYIDLESQFVAESAAARCFPTSYGIPDKNGKLKKVRIGLRVFHASAHVPHVGNLCWDGVRMPRKEARRLIAYLLYRGWQLTSGPTQSDLYPGGTFDSASQPNHIDQGPL
jgi:hypothetical protein